MPNVVVYVPAADARRIESQGHEVKVHVKEIVRAALNEERRDQPLLMIPGQMSVDELKAVPEGCAFDTPRGTKCKSCGKVH